MNTVEHLYTCFVEELGEIAKVVSKIQRFGIGDKNPATGVTNLEELTQEIIDAVAVFDMLKQHVPELSQHNPPVNLVEKIKEKQDKVLRYMEYAKKRGRLV